MTTDLTTLSFLGWIQKNSPPDVMRLGQHMQYGDEVKYVTVNFNPKQFKTIEIIHFTDMQFGHVMCREDRVREFVDWVLARRNRFVLLGGDVVDAATQFSIASPYENKWKPSTQCIKFVEAVLPMRHRILGYVGGNHERRTDKTFGSLGRFVAMLLKVPYSEGQQFIDVHFGDWKPFKISLWHGSGSAKTKGAKANVIERFMNQGDSHLYLVGHLHDCLIIPAWRMIRKNNQIVKEKKVGAMSSSFLEFFGTYAEIAGLTATDVMMARTILEPDGHFEVTVR